MTEREKTRASIATRYADKAKPKKPPRPRISVPPESRSETFHEYAVMRLSSQRPSIKVGRFMQSIKAVMKGVVSFDGGDCSEWRDLFGWFRRIPDAFEIDAARCHVTCYEVEDTSPISVEKMRDYVTLWWGFDEVYWTMSIVCLNRVGEVTGEIDPFEWSMLSQITSERKSYPYAMPSQFVATQLRAMTGSMDKDIAGSYSVLAPWKLCTT